MKLSILVSLALVLATGCSGSPQGAEDASVQGVEDASVEDASVEEPPATLTINSTPTLNQGATFQYTASGTLADGSSTITWASSEPAVATIDANGLAVAKTAGISQITAFTGGVTSAASSLTVSSETLVSIELTPANPALAGLTQQFIATGTFSDGSTSDISKTTTWVSGITGTATIASDGLATGVAVGSTDITATNDIVTSPVSTLTINAAAVKSIDVTPHQRSFPEGLLQNFVAILTQWDGLLVNANTTATWASSHHPTATINTDGIAIGLDPGTTNITATQGGVTSNSVATTVTAPAPVLFAYGINNSAGFGNIAGSDMDPATGDLTSNINLSFDYSNLQSVGGTAYGIDIDPTGKFVFAPSGANNDVSVFKIDPLNDGMLTPVPGSPFATSARPFDVAVDPTGRFAYVTAESVISAYSIDATTGALTPVTGISVAAALGNITIDPTGKFAYVTTLPESNLSVYAFTINATTGGLTEVVGSPYTVGGTPFDVDGVAVHPTGKFAFVSSSSLSGNGQVSSFSIDATSGALTPVTGSPFTTGDGTARSQGIKVDPTGKFAFVPNTDQGTVSALTIDATTGALTLVTGSPFATTTSSPNEVAVDPSGKFVLVGGENGVRLDVYSIDAITGALTPLTGSPEDYPSAGRSISVWGGLRQ